MRKINIIIFNKSKKLINTIKTAIYRDPHSVILQRERERERERVINKSKWIIFKIFFFQKFRLIFISILLQNICSRKKMKIIVFKINKNIFLLMSVLCILNS